MQRGHDGQDEQESLRGTKGLPVRGDEEKDTGPEEKAAEPEGQPRRPAEGRLLRPLALPRTDPLGRIPLEEPGLHPAAER